MSDFWGRKRTFAQVKCAQCGVKCDVNVTVGYAYLDRDDFGKTVVLPKLSEENAAIAGALRGRRILCPNCVHESTRIVLDLPDVQT